MRVLYRVPYPYFFSQHDSVGGHIAHSLGIVEGLVDDGHDVTVLAHEGKEAFEQVGATFVQSGGSGRGLLWRQYWLYAYFRQSRRLLQRRSYDLTYTRYSASATPHLWWALRREDPVGVLEINSMGAQRVAGWKYLDAQVLRAADVPIVVSTTLKDWIAAHLSREVSDRVHVVPNGVSRSRFRDVPEELAAGPFQCAFAGLLKPDYGLECLLDAAPLLHDEDVWIHIFGAGPHAAEVQARAADVPNVSFHGRLPFEDVPDRLTEMDCLVHTTTPTWSHQSPTKLYEYMAIGRPILAARTGPTERILQAGALGTLYEMESPAALRDAVLEVRNTYSAALDRARKAQARVRQNHCWIHRVRSILKRVDAIR